VWCARFRSGAGNADLAIQLESDVGVIKQVVLVDFMCHRHLKVDFGPRMNFLVGHNGSELPWNGSDSDADAEAAVPV
jgi:hypothetical protein